MGSQATVTRLVCMPATRVGFVGSFDARIRMERDVRCCDCVVIACCVSVDELIGFRVLPRLLIPPMYTQAPTPLSL